VDTSQYRYSEGRGVEEETFPECGGEAADRRGDVGADASVAKVARSHGVNANQVLRGGDGSARVVGGGARNGKLSAGAL